MTLTATCKHKDHQYCNGQWETRNFKAPGWPLISGTCKCECHSHDTEDKGWWVEKGNNDEADFLKLCERTGILPGIRAHTGNVWEPEFTYNGKPLDLKTVRTPFYLAGKNYGLNPSKTVTLNVQDIEDCTTKYPGCQIVFWVNWPTSKKYGVPVEALSGIWFMDTATIQTVPSMYPVHTYQKRIMDKGGNAKDSYLIPIDKLERVA